MLELPFCRLVESRTCCSREVSAASEKDSAEYLAGQHRMGVMMNCPTMNYVRRVVEEDCQEEKDLKWRESNVIRDQR